jgi:hypothetical protein
VPSRNAETALVAFPIGSRHRGGEEEVEEEEEEVERAIRSPIAETMGQK